METEALVKEQGADCHSFVCDVTKKSEVDDVAQAVRETAGHVDILVNNAGTHRLIIQSPQLSYES